MLRVMVYNLQCKHIIFGPCHDKGYIVELRPYQLETVISTKLSLLETTPAPRDFQELRFRRVQFPNVFRSELLPESPAPTFTPSLPPTNSTNYADVASKWRSNSPLVNEFKSFMISPSEKPVKSTKSPKPVANKGKYYIINSSGERLDEPLPRCDPNAEARLAERTKKESRGPCNRYHLLGSCDEYYCTYYHGERFGPAELLVLRIKARGSPCNFRGQCVNAGCAWGHNCRYGGKKCTRNGSCNFAFSHDWDLVSSLVFLSPQFDCLTWVFLCYLLHRDLAIAQLLKQRPPSHSVKCSKHPLTLPLVTFVLANMDTNTRIDTSREDLRVWFAREDVTLTSTDKQLFQHSTD
ncbi:uncharacterized protein F4822DRAFT_143447 [Hypoxylon trugodes]|uniref:uncharacterized protein n=1 Tax=Hypoxylon trugodes TaxID=326681 RepID=UPI0021902F85|nr:uncharacterized protein F4822DRAFT_143447 [Hypoxylon trugodes]KAI1392860.1 hypothetical protein F4822DRAFT_143447 [Hypoxylon trugodes]